MPNFSPAEAVSKPVVVTVESQVIALVILPPLIVKSPPTVTFPDVTKDDKVPTDVIFV